MPFLVHDDERGWLKSYTRDYTRGRNVDCDWGSKRRDAHQFQTHADAKELALPGVAILESREP